MGISASSGGGGGSGSAAADAGSEAAAAEGAEPKRKMPSRPVFTLFGPPGHFATLAAKVTQFREAEKRRVDREWAAKDAQNMAAAAEAADAKEAAKPALLRKSTTRMRV